MSDTKPKTTKPAEPTEPATTSKPAETTKKNEPVVLGISSSVRMPEHTNGRGSKAKYNVAGLQVGESIPIIGKTKKEMYGICQAANRRYAEESDQMKPIKIKDANGNTVEKPGTEPIMKPTRFFFAVDCDPATDPDGATVRIFRKF